MTEVDNKNQLPNLCNMYFDLLEDCSECPTLYHRWSLISSVGALLGRQAKLSFGMDTIYPNMYVCLLGNAGTRKSSAINSSRKILEAVGYDSFSRERTSKEKFLKDLGSKFEADMDIPHGISAEDLGDVKVNDTPEDRGCAETYINAGELEDFLGQGDGPFISLLTNLWDNRDKYEHGKMTSKDIYIYQPTINMIGGCTPTTFSNVFPPESIGQGMISRMILVYGAGPRKKITFPPPPDKVLLDKIIKRLEDIKTVITGEFKVTSAALKIFDDVYQSDFTLEDSRFESYSSRRHVHLFKLTMILAAMNLSMTITDSIVIEANSILHFTEKYMPRALGEFGKAKNAEAINNVVNTLTSHYLKTTDGLSVEQLFKQVSKDFESYSRDFSVAIQKLIQSSTIEARDGKLFPVTKTTQGYQVPHIDVKMLREFKDSN